MKKEQGTKPCVYGYLALVDLDLAGVAFALAVVARCLRTGVGASGLEKKPLKKPLTAVATVSLASTVLAVAVLITLRVD